MAPLYSYKIYNSTALLPVNWNDVAQENVFLSTDYLTVLEKSSPVNMTYNFIGLFNDEQLIGIAIAQYIDLNQLQSFGERDKCLKKYIRNFIFKTFSSRVLVIGNNMLTGQNAFCIVENYNKVEAIKTLKLAASELENFYKKIHITLFKDFEENEIQYFEKADFKDFFLFSTQPNMVFKVNKNWKSQLDYIDSLTKKYRDQYKRSHKKLDGIIKRKMELDEIQKHQKELYNLYFYVAKNAPFNTFFLAENHFEVFKQNLQDKFLVYGYFLNEKLIGFNTLIKNKTALDTYFLGYDETLQREKMLYLNMLYDMIGYAVKKQFKEIILARTALEIKSSVGAQPIKMIGYIKHSNPFLNRYMSTIFPYLEPETIWQERNPFK